MTGPRVSGAFTITLSAPRPDETLDTDTPYVHVGYGQDGYSIYADDRDDRPVVNGVQLVGV